MEVRIRKSKHQKANMSSYQFKFASECVHKYMRNSMLDKSSYMIYEGYAFGDSMGCDVYQTKSTVSAIVYFKDE